MIKYLKAAIKGVRLELAAGQSGWVNLADMGSTAGASYASTAGKSVSVQTALNVSAVWDCTKKTSQLIGALPLTLFEKAKDGSKVPLENTLSEILTIRPNPHQTASEFWSGMTMQMVLHGNAYAEKLYLGKNLVGLRPMFNVSAKPLIGGGVEYLVNDRGRLFKMPADKVFHLRGFGSGDGMGLSAIKFGANSLGAALAADETAGKVFSNSMMASGVIQTEQTLDETQRAQLQTMLGAYVGSGKAGKIMTLEAGLSFSQLQMNPEDAQLLETRRFSVEDVCRWFGVPPIVIGHAADGQTMWGSGVEAIMLSWLTLGINPLLVGIEDRILHDLVPAERRRRQSAKFNREAMLQMDSAAKAAFLGVMANTGTMSANERRHKIGMPAHPDPKADELMAQGAMAPLNTLGEGRKNE